MCTPCVENKPNRMHNSDAIQILNCASDRPCFFLHRLFLLCFFVIRSNSKAKASMFVFKLLFLSARPRKRWELSWIFQELGGNIGACQKRWFQVRNTATLDFWSQCSICHRRYRPSSSSIYQVVCQVSRLVHKYKRSAPIYILIYICIYYFPYYIKLQL